MAALLASPWEVHRARKLELLGKMLHVSLYNLRCFCCPIFANVTANYSSPRISHCNIKRPCLCKKIPRITLPEGWTYLRRWIWISCHSDLTGECKRATRVHSPLSSLQSPPCFLKDSPLQTVVQCVAPHLRQSNLTSWRVLAGEPLWLFRTRGEYSISSLRFCCQFWICLL